MPLYQYQCRACEIQEERIAGIDDRALICTECGDVMDRLVDTQKAYESYWKDFSAAGSSSIA